MLDETSRIESITQVLVEGVRVRAMIAAGNLDATAAVRPCKRLRCADEQATDAALAIIGSDDKARDAAERAIGMKERDTMK